ncbi:TPA: hypothetical protein I7215_21200 [Vibrio vulnificus]|nr:hypothetical protein [Vibrio vulnificus]
MFSFSWVSLSIRFSKSAIQDCLFIFMNLSGRKTCQGLRVASLVFIAGW